MFWQGMQWISSHSPWPYSDTPDIHQNCWNLCQWTQKYIKNIKKQRWHFRMYFTCVYTGWHVIFRAPSGLLSTPTLRISTKHGRLEDPDCSAPSLRASVSFRFWEPRGVRSPVASPTRTRGWWEDLGCTRASPGLLATPTLQSSTKHCRLEHADCSALSRRASVSFRFREPRGVRSTVASPTNSRGRWEDFGCTELFSAEPGAPDVSDSECSMTLHFGSKTCGAQLRAVTSSAVILASAMLRAFWQSKGCKESSLQIRQLYVGLCLVKHGPKTNSRVSSRHLATSSCHVYARIRREIWIKLAHHWRNSARSMTLMPSLAK